MSTDKSKKKNYSLANWQIGVLFFLLFGFVGLMVERPQGSINGQIALGQKGFGLTSYNIRSNKVYVVATGPRYGKTISRGSYVLKDGSFTVSQLPVGEYSLRIRAPGFESAYINSIMVEEGKSTSCGGTIAMDVLEPYISIGSNRRVFTTKDSPQFWVNATGAVETTIKIYKKNILEELASKKPQESGVDVGSNLSLYPTYNKKFHNLYAEEKPFKQFKRQLKPSYSDSARANFKLSSGLEQGDYITIAEALDVTGKKRVSTIWWFSVTNIGLIVKNAPNQTLARAINLLNSQPISGADISLCNRNSNYSEVKPVKTLKTDDSGIVMFDKGDARASSRYLVIGKHEGGIAYSGDSYWRGDEKHYQTYFYTDRPVYRLGQTVSYKVISRELIDKGLKNIGSNVALNVTVEDPTNSRLQSTKIKTTPHGSASGTFEIPEDGKTGSYQIRFTYPNGRTSYQSFAVEQYRKPEYKVEIIPNSKRYVAGGKVKARVKATYFFGAPVANAHIKYSVYESRDYSTRYNLEPRPDYYSFYDGWEEESGSYDNYHYGGSFVNEGTSRTDENGECEIEFDTKKISLEKSRPYFYYDYGEKNYRIEADVTDISQLTVSSSSNTLVTAGDFALFVEPQSYVVSVGQPLVSTIRALDYEGKPIANQEINVKLSRFPWDRANSNYRDEKVLANTQAKTNEKGEAVVNFTVGQQYPTDTFYITASAKDGHNNTVYYGNSVWVASDSSPYVLTGGAEQKQSFKITLDKKVYKPGETAKVMISGPFNGKEGFDALVTTESTKIHDYKLIPLDATAKMVEIPIKDAYCPNVFVSVVCVGAKKQFFKMEKMIMVSPEDHFLNITVKSNKEKYKPGETASYLISAKYKDGKPAPDCEVSLGVVDESIYSIRPDSTPNMRKFFYKRRNNWVWTKCSFPEEYSGGPDKAAVKIRKNFKDTAAWFPALRTDKNGEVVAKVKLPDNLTTWRATARGITMNTDVGSCVQKILVTKDIIARLALPRFFTKGDKGQISAIVHNYSDTDQKINLSLRLDSRISTNLPLAKTLSIAKDKAERFTWPVSINKIGKSKITLIARGETGSDALQKSLNINPLGLPMARVSQGVLTPQKNSVTIKPLQESGATDVKRTLKLAGSTFAQLKGSYGSLIEYPYGCTEQTMSRLVPSIVAYQLNGKFGIKLEPTQIEKFKKVKVKALRRLKDLQHYDGGWGWWSNDRSDPFLTAYVLEGFRLLYDSKQSYDPTMAKSGVKWLNRACVLLHKQLTDPKLVDNYLARQRRADLARMVYVQTIYNVKPNKTVLAWLNKNHKQFTPEPLTYLVLANHNAGNKKEARKVYAYLTSLGNETASTFDWEHNLAMRKKLGYEKFYDYTYRYTGVETTALALKAVVAMEPGNYQKINKIKSWLLLNRSKDGWKNTKTTAQVLLSLMDEAIKTGNSDGTSIVAELLDIGGEMESFSFTGEEVFKKEKAVNLRGDFLKKDLTLSLQGEGRLYYQNLNEFYKTLKPGEKLKIQNSPSELSIKREFFKLKTQSSKSDGTLNLRALPLNGGTIEPGEIILMKVYVNAPMSLPYVIVECPLPSGAEVVKSRGQENNLASATGESIIEGDWGAPWWSHQDILDDKLVFFGTSVRQGKSEFHTLLRMELPGTVQINPVTLEGMYTDLIKGYSQPKELKVRAK